MKKDISPIKSGFTLIELLITIAIIGILASIGLVTYPKTQKLARDAQRKSDLKQYQTSLENYANKTDGIYPETATIQSLCTTLGIGSCALEPNGTYQYRYSGTSTTYVLCAKLEAKTNTYWRVYSNGETREDTSCP